MALLNSVHCRQTPLSYSQYCLYNGTPQSSVMLLRDRLARAKNLFRKDLKGHFGCVNAIEFSHGGGEIIASGGDDRRVLVWNTEKCVENRCVPIPMKGQHHSNIFCVAFDNSNKKVFSGGNDEQVIIHDIETKQTLDVFLHEEAVYGISVDPINDNVFASACDDGKIVLYDIRAPASEDPFCVAHYRSPMHSVTYNPVEPRLIATANAKEGFGLWDVRFPKRCLLRYGGENAAQSCMSVRINRRGDALIGLRRRLPPVMYNLRDAAPVCQFDHNGYYNSCTMKSCCFAGDDDQYILSGSDDFGLYMWKLPDASTEVKWMPEAHLVLKGHRSIANQVRFNPDNHLIISSGVEKVIKMWSPFPVPYCQGDLGDDEFDYSERPVYTHEEYISLVLRSGQVMSHDYSTQSTDEDPRMMAFFDSLVQREVEGWSSDEDSLGDSDTGGNLQSFVLHGDISDDSNSADTLSNHSVHSADDDGGHSPFTMAFAIAMARRARQAQNEVRDRPESFLDVHSSFMDRLDELGRTAGEDSPAAGALPGQRPNAARKSITELINQKRKEYVNKATRKKAREQSAIVMETESTSCSSESSDSESNCKALNLKKKCECKARSETKKRKLDIVIGGENEADMTAASTSTNGATDVMKQLAAERDRVKFRMQRIKAMRERVVQGDSSDNEKKTSDSQGGKRKHGEPSCTYTPSSSREQHNVNTYDANGAECSSKSEEHDDPEDSRESPKAMEFQNRLPNSESNGVTNVRNGKVLGSVEESTEGNVQGKVQPHSSICYMEPNGVTSETLNGDAVNGLNGLANGHSSGNNSSGASNTDAPTAETQPIWAEFKRFRNHVEKARRQYRRASGNRDNSGCSSGEEN